MALDLLQLWRTWLIIAALLISITTSLVGIVYLLSYLLSNDRMRTWAKLEFIEIFYSIVILLLVITAVPIVDGIVQGGLGVSNAGSGSGSASGAQTSTLAWVRGPGGVDQLMDICGDPIASVPGSVYSEIYSCHIRLAIWYLRTLFDEGKVAAFNIYMSYIGTSVAAEFAINLEFIFEMGGFMTVNPWKGFFAIGNIIKSMVFDWYIKLMMLNKFQEVFIRFIAVGLFQVLFVIGVVLRTFPFTRKLGGLLLALAISLYFVFPAFYAFGALVALDLKENVRNNPTLNPDHLADPPIANSMYLNTSVHALGGDINPGDARTALVRLEQSGSVVREGTTYEEFMNMIEGTGGRGLYRPGYDFSRSTASTPAARQGAFSTLVSAARRAYDWINVFSSESKFDNFVTTAWSPNGVIESISRLTFWSMFFSLLGILATISATRSLSITFGGDVEIAGLTRLI